MGWGAGLRIAAAALERSSAVIALAGSLVVTLALYGRAMGYAFFFDDTFDLTRFEGQGYLDILTSAEGYSYYRPIPFVVWKLSHDLLGYYDQTLLHALPILAHALAGWLLFLLVRRLGAGYWAAVPALLFLTYPFSYQDVAIVGVVFHSFAGAAILGSLNLYHLARLARGRRASVLHLSAGAATAIALWSHESGVLVLPLLLLLEAIILWRAGTRRPSAWLGMHAGLMVLFVVAWFTVEKASPTDVSATADLRFKYLFYVQAFAYPLTAQLRWMDATVGWAPGTLDVFVASLVLITGVWLAAAWFNGRRGVGLAIAALPPILALLIAVAAALPAIWRLSWAYIVDAPRLLYLVGLAAALFWGLLPALRFDNRVATMIWRGVTLALLIAVAAQSWVFVDRRMEMFDSATRAMDGLVAAGERYPGQKVVVVNMPSWLALDEYEYQYGHLGVQIVPAYIGLDRAIYASSEHAAEVDVLSVSLNPDVSGGPYTFGPHGAEVDQAALDDALRDGRAVIGVHRDGGGFAAFEAGRLIVEGAEQHPHAIEVAGGDILISSVRVASEEQRMSVYLSWNVVSSLDGPAAVVLVLREPDGPAAETIEQLPLLGLTSPNQWQPGDRIDDGYWFKIPDSGRYQLEIGLRDVESGELLAPGLVAAGEIAVERRLGEVEFLPMQGAAWR